MCQSLNIFMHTPTTTQWICSLSALISNKNKPEEQCGNYSSFYKIFIFMGSKVIRDGVEILGHYKQVGEVLKARGFVSGRNLFSKAKKYHLSK